jgi:hypothetical protein
MVRTGFAETVDPGVILLCDEHPVAVLPRFLHGGLRQEVPIFVLLR